MMMMIQLYVQLYSEVTRLLYCIIVRICNIIIVHFLVDDYSRNVEINFQYVIDLRSIYCFVFYPVAPAER